MCHSVIVDKVVKEDQDGMISNERHNDNGATKSIASTLEQKDLG